ncbi:MAG: hypothetical protein HYZ62_01455 [Candidatus Andersenbacteria bacterium]|nr:hypothetical protein [Candidatus Andersenbacteria bacterium]
MKLAWHEQLLLTVALILLVVLACQYPLTSSFPMGGDAAAYIKNIKNLGKTPYHALGVIAGTWYPGIYAILAPASLLPFLGWPVKFMWWMAFGQIATGLSLGRAVWKTGGPMSSFLAMGLWACTPIILTPMFEDGTLAQLWSLPWFILSLDSFLAGNIRKTGIYVLATFATHPISAIVAALSFIISSPFLLRQQSQLPVQQKKLVSVCLAGLIIGFIAVIGFRNEILTLSFKPETSPYAKELIFGSFERWFMLAIPGFYLLIRKMKKYTPSGAAVFSAFVFISALLAFNDQLGIGIWTKRLSPYLLIAAIWCAAYAFPRLLYKLTLNKAVASLAAGIIISIHGIGTYTENQRILGLYESPSRYLRTSPDEIAAIAWLQEYIEPGQHVITSIANRHTEYLGALTDIQYNELPDEWVQKKLQTKTYTAGELILLLKRRESIPKELMAASPHIVVFENKDTVVLSLEKLP